MPSGGQVYRRRRPRATALSLAGPGDLSLGRAFVYHRRLSAGSPRDAGCPGRRAPRSSRGALMPAPEIPRVRVGMVGAGFVARVHAEAYRQVHGVEGELSWVAAARPERAAAFAAGFGARPPAADARAISA